MPDPARYYRRHGREVAALLGAFGIDLVIDGHRLERTGVQKDYELESWLPGFMRLAPTVHRVEPIGPGKHRVGHCKLRLERQNRHDQAIATFR